MTITSVVPSGFMGSLGRVALVRVPRKPRSWPLLCDCTRSLSGVFVTRTSLGPTNVYTQDDLRNVRVGNVGEIRHRFWQPGSGGDENVGDIHALHTMTEDIHLNPVRRGLVKPPEPWMWSSATDWWGQSG
jgi:hypothetical protein